MWPLPFFPFKLFAGFSAALAKKWIFALLVYAQVLARAARLLHVLWMSGEEPNIASLFSRDPAGSVPVRLFVGHHF